MGDKTRGVYNKFKVERTDGKSAVGEKHFGCDYWVLDLTHDDFALPALEAYAAACERTYPLLYADLMRKITQLRHEQSLMIPRRM